MVLQSFLTLVRFLAQIAIVSNNFHVLLESSVMNPLMVLQILHLLKSHPADVAGDDKTSVVYFHVNLVLVTLDKLFPTETAGVFVPGLPFVYHCNVTLEALLVAV